MCPVTKLPERLYRNVFRLTGTQALRYARLASAGVYWLLTTVVTVYFTVVCSSVIGKWKSRIDEKYGEAPDLAAICPDEHMRELVKVVITGREPNLPVTFQNQCNKRQMTVLQKMLTSPGERITARDALNILREV